MAETEKKAEGKGPRRAKPWLDRIEARLKDEDKWRNRGIDVIKRFRDERDRKGNDSTSRINILWSNTEVLRSALYARTAVPDVRRRFPDAAGGDPLTRTAAEVIERSLAYCNDTYDVDSPVEDALLDCLLPGRGTTWVVYEPEIIGEGEDASVGEQKLWDEYVYWKDFVHGKARTWQKVPWVARRHAMALGQFKKKFPKAEEEPDLSSTLLDNDEREQDAAMNDDDGLVEVWEIWDRGTKERIYIAKGFKNEVQRDEDPLGLPDFFPCPRPMYSVKTTDSLIPEPEFTLYQDQADELDRVAGRIKVLLEALRWKGIYDGSIDGENILSTLAAAGDNKFLAYPNWNMLKEKGGIENAVGFWPLDRIIIVLEQLYPRIEMLVQEIYEITGISDVIRGATDPNETLGAQKLKSQFGSMRMQKRQRDVQRYVRDIYRIKAAIIAEHFTKETLEAITNVQLPTAEEQAKAKAILAAKQSPGMGHNGGPPLESPSPPAGNTSPPPPVGGPSFPPDGAMAAPPRMPGMNGARPPMPGVPPPGMPGGGAAIGIGGPPSGGPPPGMPPPGMPPPGGPRPPPPEEEEPEVDPVLEHAATSPTWEDLIDLLRSDKLMAYRIDIETDSTVLVDAEAEKESRVEFIRAASELLKGAMEMITTAPATIPLVKEIFLFGVRSFKAGRTLEQAFEDAFDKLTENPPEPPEEAPTGPDPEIEKAKVEVAVQEIKTKYGFEEKKAMAEDAHRKQSLAADDNDKKTKSSLEMRKLDIDAKVQADKVALEMEKLKVEREKLALERERMALESRKLDQDASFKAREIDDKSTIEHRKIDEDTAIKQRQLDDAKSMGARDIGLRAAAQNKQLVDEKAAASEEGEVEAPSDLLGVSTLQKSIEVMAQSLSEAQRAQTEVMAEGFKQQSGVLEDLIKQNSMPKEVVRGPDNRIVGIRPVNGG